MTGKTTLRSQSIVSHVVMPGRNVPANRLKILEFRTYGRKQRTNVVLPLEVGITAKTVRAKTRMNGKDFGWVAVQIQTKLLQFAAMTLNRRSQTECLHSGNLAGRPMTEFPVCPGRGFSSAQSPAATKLYLPCRAPNASRRLNDTNRHVLLNTVAATTVKGMRAEKQHKNGDSEQADAFRT